MANPKFDSALLWRDAGKGAFRALLLSAFIVGMRTVSDDTGAMAIDYRPWDVVAIVLAVFLVRLALPVLRVVAPVRTGIAAIIGFFVTIGLASHIGQVGMAIGLIACLVIAISCLTEPIRAAQLNPLAAKRGVPSPEDGPAGQTRKLALVGLALAIAFPLTPLADRYWLDLLTLVLTYLVLGWGLNIVVGLAGLLDLGFVAFYAVGAYSYALLSLHLGVSFWVALPLAAALSALAGFLLGFPVLRLRGDYFAIVTLGFGEIIRIVLLNWTDMSGGPDGLSGIPRPSFFGLAEFTRTPDDGGRAFHEMFGLDYSTEHRVIFLYLIILALACFAFYIAGRLRQMPIGRAWEALREDAIACRAMGISLANIKLWAFMTSAAFGGLAGAFFATRQGYVSPESFTFQESAMVLAIVVLGGMGSRLGVLLATVVIVGLPEVFRDVEEYRMLAFGAAMIMIMIWRPGGLLSTRAATLRLSHATRAPKGGEQ